MPVRNEALRRAKYKAKNNADVIRERFAGQKSNMDTQIDGVFPQLTAMEDAVKEALEAAGVPTIQVPFYLNFGRECWRIKKRFGSPTCNDEIGLMYAKWAGRGLTSPMLDLVKSSVA